MDPAARLPARAELDEVLELVVREARAYLASLDERPVPGAIGPESSRRGRALAVWATLRAYGRTGVRAWVERHLDLAQRLARAVDAASELERLAEVRLCIVCFRYAPPWVPAERLDELNTALGEALLEDGRFYVGTTRHAGRVALRPALVNWRTREEDVERFVEVVREVGSQVARRILVSAGGPGGAGATMATARTLSASQALVGLAKSLAATKGQTCPRCQGPARW